MRKLHIICPTCNRSKRIPIPEEIFQLDEGSLLKLKISKGKICEHQFMLLIDYNFSIRDYEIAENEFSKLNENHNLNPDLSIFDFSL